MEPYALPTSTQGDSMIFLGNSTIESGEQWYTWTKPAGKAMASFVIIGAGGGGGSGAIGAAGTAAGGGGGSSGAMTVIDMPLHLLPPRLYISVGYGAVGYAASTWVSTQPNTTSNHVIGYAMGGNPGSDANNGTAGAGSPGGFAATAANMPLGWQYTRFAATQQVGSSGGATSAGVAVTLPVTGLRLTGGTGGAGVPASGAGLAGGTLTTPASPSYFIAHTGGVAPATATTAPGVGKSGVNIRDAGMFYYGGTGGASTHATATGAGLVQAAGGNGGIGCGGGGMGGALTGSTPAKLSSGGSGMVMITCY